MIKAKSKGLYKISLDGGVTFINESDNLLTNNYYNKSSFTANMNLVVGSGTTPPSIFDQSLDLQFAISSTESGFDPLAITEIFSDRFEITYSRTFDLGNGYSQALTELGINNPNLCSRTLLKDGSGNPTSINLLPQDHLVIIYSVIYSISRLPQDFSLTINTIPVTATVTAVNGNAAWGGVNLGQIVDYDNIGVDVGGTWSIDTDGNILGPNISNPLNVNTLIDNTGGLSIIGTSSAGLNDWNQTFQQILITTSGTSFLSACVLIDLDVPVSKNNNQDTNISINSKQEI